MIYSAFLFGGAWYAGEDARRYFGHDALMLAIRGFDIRMRARRRVTGLSVSLRPGFMRWLSGFIDGHDDASRFICGASAPGC